MSRPTGSKISAFSVCYKADPRPHLPTALRAEALYLNYYRSLTSEYLVIETIALQTTTNIIHRWVGEPSGRSRKNLTSSLFPSFTRKASELYTHFDPKKLPRYLTLQPD